MDKTQKLMVFAIDDKLRTITMPNNGSVFGVSGDIEVNQVEFQMPRYCAGFDMTDFIGRVNYVNPNGDSNYYESEISGTDDTVSFIWLMKPDVTRYSGDVKFSVKLYKKQDGKILKQFNTRSAVGRVLEGFDVIDSVTPEEQETLLHKIEAEIKEEVKAYIDQYAEDKVSEMTQGLPDLDNFIRIADHTRLTPVFEKKGLYWSCNTDYKLCVLYANEYKEAKVYEVHKGKRYTVCGMSDGNSTSPLVIFSKTYPTVKGETSSYANFIAGSNSESRITTEKHIISPIDGYMLITSSTVYGGYAIEESVRLIIDDRYGLYVSDGCYTTFSKIGNNTYLCRIFKNVYINQLFDFNGCYIGKFDEYGELYKYKDFGTFPSDVVGPIAIRENSWSATTKFSGGSHGININGTEYPTAKQKFLLVKCGEKTVDADGYYMGRTEFLSTNALYIPMTITGNDLSSAKEGIEEIRHYCIDDVLSVSVDYNILTDIIADVLYGLQLQIYGMEKVTLPNNEVKVSIDQEQNYVFEKPENKYICTNESGEYCSVEMSTCGLGDFSKNNGESDTKYGYISVFKKPNKIYFQLINHGIQLASGKTLHWDVVCDHKPH